VSRAVSEVISKRQGQLETYATAPFFQCVIVTFEQLPAADNVYSNSSAMRHICFLSRKQLLLCRATFKSQATGAMLPLQGGAAGHVYVIDTDTDDQFGNKDSRNDRRHPSPPSFPSPSPLHPQMPFLHSRVSRNLQPLNAQTKWSARLRRCNSTSLHTHCIFATMFSTCLKIPAQATEEMVKLQRQVRGSCCACALHCCNNPQCKEMAMRLENKAKSDLCFLFWREM
jgi:hypothetical protein